MALWVVGGIVAVSGVIGAAIPSLLGFGATIAAGSAAAAWQATIGNVIAGSTFAILQSWAATGWITWIFSSTFMAIPALIAAIARFLGGSS